jgi:hypothetical protein
MKFTFQKRPSPAMVVAVVALSLGLAGSAVAAKDGLGKAQLKTLTNKQITKRAPGLAVASAKSADTATSADSSKRADTASAVAPNAVTGAGIVDGSVETADLSNTAVTGAKVVDESIGKLDLADDSVFSDEIARDAVGSDEIVASAVRASELAEQKAVVSPGVTVQPGTARTTVVNCPNGTRLLAGGYAWTTDGLNSIITSAPEEQSANNRWVVRGFVPSGAPANGLFAWATCLTG